MNFISMACFLAGFLLVFVPSNVLAISLPSLDELLRQLSQISSSVNTLEELVRQLNIGNVSGVPSAGQGWLIPPQTPSTQTSPAPSSSSNCDINKDGKIDDFEQKICGQQTTGQTSPTQIPSGQTQTPQAGSMTGKCGDGTCDGFEKANPNACPQDCKTPTSPTTSSCSNYDLNKDGKIDELEQRICQFGLPPTSQQQRQTSTAISKTQKPFIDDSPFGIHDPTVPDVDKVEDVAETGAKWIRYAGRSGTQWDVIETQKGKYDWDYYDNLYLDTYKNGIKMMISLLPHNKLDNGNIAPNELVMPKNINWWLEFLQKAVERYDGDGKDDAPGSPVVDVWEIGNEFDAFWKDTPENYALLLKNSYQVVKKANPKAKVAFNGLALLDASGIQKFFIPALDELEKIKDSPNDKYFEIAGFHWVAASEGDNYQKSTSPLSKKIYYFDAPVKEMKEEMEKRSYKNTFIWIGEMSYNDGTVEDRTGKLPYRSEKEQAKELFKRFVYPLAKGVGKIFWVTLTEWSNFGGMGVNNYFDQVGLINNSKNDGQSHKKLAYYTYKKMAEVLEGSDWNNIETIQEKDGIYVYKFLKNGKPIWVAWNDNAGQRQITISGITPNQIRITEVVPKYESGKDVSDYAAAFNTETKSVSGGQTTITLGDGPMFVESIDTEEGGIMIQTPIPTQPQPPPQFQEQQIVVFSKNLYRGLKSDEVIMLQQFLAEDKDIYPEGLITGYFGPLTEKAVQRFQCKYNIVCSGNPFTTGYGNVGPKTRAKLNELISGQTQTSQKPAFPKSQVERDYFYEFHMEPGNATNEMFDALEKLVNLSNKYKIELTLLFTPPWVEMILKDDKKPNLLQQWRQDGHEIGGHHHGPSACPWDGYTNLKGQELEKKRNEASCPEFTREQEKYLGNMDNYMELLNKIGIIKTITMSDEDVDWPSGVFYAAGGRPLQEAISMPRKVIFNSHEVIKLTAAGFTPPGLFKQAKLLFGKTNEPEVTISDLKEIFLSSLPGVFGVVSHPESYKEAPQIYEEWFKFLNSVDPKGEYSYTISKIIEKHYKGE